VVLAGDACKTYRELVLGTQLLTIYLPFVSNKEVISYSKHLHNDNPNQDIKNTLYFTKLLKQTSC